MSKQDPVIVQIRDFLFKRFIDETESVIYEATTTHTPNTDRSVATTRHLIGVDGALTSLEVAVISGTPRRDVYVRCTLEDESQIVRGILFRGYLEGSASPHGAGAIPVKATWRIRLDSYSSMSSAPILLLRGTIMRGSKQIGGWSGTDESSTGGPGALKFISGTDPAVGAEISETVPTGARWKIRNVRFQIVTSTITATRSPRITYDNGTTVFLAIPAGTTVAANSPRTFCVPSGFTGIETAFDSAQEIRIPVPPDIILFAGYRIKTSTGAIQSGDNYGQPFLQVEEWLEA